MTREASWPDGARMPAAPYSPVVTSEDLVWTAGQVPVDGDGETVGDDIATQTRQVLANVDACLRVAGCSTDDVVRVGAFLADLADFEAFNEEYRRHFTAPYPARTTVQAGLAPGFLVEIDVVARRPRAAT